MSGKKAREARKRNLTVLLARAQVEVSEGGPGLYMVDVRHDDTCMGLINESMLECTRKPEMNFTSVSYGGSDDSDKWERG